MTGADPIFGQRGARALGSDFDLRKLNVPGWIGTGSETCLCRGEGWGEELERRPTPWILT